MLTRQELTAIIIVPLGFFVLAMTIGFPSFVALTPAMCALAGIVFLLLYRRGLL